MRLTCDNCGYCLTTGGMTAFTRDRGGVIEKFPDLREFPHERWANGERPGMLVRDYCLVCRRQVERVLFEPGCDLSDSVTSDRACCPKCGNRELLSQSQGPVDCPSCRKGTLLLPEHTSIDSV